MKKILFSLLILFVSVAIFSACGNDENDWKTDGSNTVEGRWKRDNTYPNVLAVFNSDFTSQIDKYTVDNDLEYSLSQGRYKIEGDSVLHYEKGFVNKFKLVDDSLWITYGYDTENNTTTYKYIRYK